MLQTLASWDRNLFAWVNAGAGHHPALDNVAVALAQWSPYFFAILLLVMFFIGGHALKRTALIGASSAVLSAVIGTIIGALIFRPRPFVGHPAHLLVQHAADSSFPSEHTALVFGAIAGLWPALGLGWRLLFAVLGLMVGVARVYVGVHFPGDILGGIVVGLLSAQVMHSVPWAGRLIDRSLALWYRIAGKTRHKAR